MNHSIMRTPAKLAGSIPAPASLHKYYQGNGIISSADFSIKVRCQLEKTFARSSFP